MNPYCSMPEGFEYPLLYNSN